MLPEIAKQSSAYDISDGVRNYAISYSLNAKTNVHYYWTPFYEDASD